MNLTQIYKSKPGKILCCIVDFERIHYIDDEQAIVMDRYVTF